jgi:hypothetical protein
MRAYLLKGLLKVMTGKGKEAKHKVKIQIQGSLYHFRSSGGGGSGGTSIHTNHSY